MPDGECNRRGVAECGAVQAWTRARSAASLTLMCLDMASVLSSSIASTQLVFAASVERVFSCSRAAGSTSSVPRQRTVCCNACTSSSMAWSAGSPVSTAWDARRITLSSEDNIPRRAASTCFAGWWTEMLARAHAACSCTAVLVLRRRRWSMSRQPAWRMMIAACVSSAEIDASAHAVSSCEDVDEHALPWHTRASSVAGWRNVGPTVRSLAQRRQSTQPAMWARGLA
mmetsp:Transcript_36430/g.96069  ORF Transcript_36430/g.96069 Transcript_36430/m.96069 type:complete len:228 (+) Transcript_36430:550-1233(+)